MVGACLYMPQAMDTGYPVLKLYIPPSEKSDFPRPKKSHFAYGCVPTFEQKTGQFFLPLLRLFFSEILSRGNIISRSSSPYQMCHPTSRSGNFRNEKAGCHSPCEIFFFLSFRRACAGVSVMSYDPQCVLQARLAKNNKKWPAFVTRLLSPGHTNPAMGFFWGVDHH